VVEPCRAADFPEILLQISQRTANASYSWHWCNTERVWKVVGVEEAVMSVVLPLVMLSQTMRSKSVQNQLELADSSTGSAQHFEIELL
jgi:hypothetical protein